MTRFVSHGLVVAGLLSSCASTQLVTVAFQDSDGNSEYWVCDAKARNCHGRAPGEVDPRHYSPKLFSVAPPRECEHGVAKMELEVHRGEIVNVGYECAQPGQPTQPVTEASNDATGDLTTSTETIADVDATTVDDKTNEPGESR